MFEDYRKRQAKGLVSIKSEEVENILKAAITDAKGAIVQHADLGEPIKVIKLTTTRFDGFGEKSEIETQITDTERERLKAMAENFRESIADIEALLADVEKA